MNVAYNQDCMEAMRAMPDGAFDLAVVDPPYGLKTVSYTHLDVYKRQCVYNAIITTLL